MIDPEAFETVAGRMAHARAEFVIEPYVRSWNEPGEHGTSLDRLLATD
jgi:hypothetical protein